MKDAARDNKLLDAKNKQLENRLQQLEGRLDDVQDNEITQQVQQEHANVIQEYETQRTGDFDDVHHPNSCRQLEKRDLTTIPEIRLINDIKSNNLMNEFSSPSPEINSKLEVSLFPEATPFQSAQIAP